MTYLSCIWGWGSRNRCVSESAEMQLCNPKPRGTVPPALHFGLQPWDHRPHYLRPMIPPRQQLFSASVLLGGSIRHYLHIADNISKNISIVKAHMLYPPLIKTLWVRVRVAGMRTSAVPCARHGLMPSHPDALIPPLVDWIIYLED